ncbi:hypothetical protein GBAR_LOCUS17816 [Geodia barretti]|uniref:Uncharacterized protein n=1 Tax=Geodia barretti TaxID=519541 RepID=A0AA35SLM7_GEOBA|nr:hypothetical protein GBAR_LOCUS17816 [Geodia barretti]
MALKCSILHNVSCGLAYLHERSPPEPTGHPQPTSREDSSAVAP